MATNADPVDDDNNEVSEEDLKKTKDSLGVETPTGEDETTETDGKQDQEEDAQDDGQTDSDSQDDDPEADSNEEADEGSSEFVKQYPNIKGDTIEEYARGVEAAYGASTSEAMRLKKLSDEVTATTKNVDVGEEDDSGAPLDPRLLYLDQMVNKDIADSFEVFKKDYPQVDDPVEYDKFKTKVASLSRFTMTEEKRVAPATELYSTVAAMLGWKPSSSTDSKERLTIAAKGAASSSRTNSVIKTKVKSKITDAEVAVAKQTWAGGMSDSEIRKQLELV